MVLTGNNYKIDNTIAFLLDRKKTYQKNIIIAQCVVIFLVGIITVTISLFLYYQEDDKIVVFDKSKNEILDSKIFSGSFNNLPKNLVGKSIENVEENSYRATQGNIITEFVGFSGLTGYKIITVFRNHQIPSMKPFSISYKPVFQLEIPSFSPLSEMVPSNGQGSSFAKNDFGLPSPTIYFPQENDNKLGWGGNIGDEGKGNKPLSIRLAHIRWPFNAPVTDTGFVELMLTVDKKGYISWQVVNESPQGFGFANAVIDALKRSKYKPTINKGEKITTTVDLKCVLCINCQPDIVNSTSNLKIVYLKN